MKFNNHRELEGKHALLSASKPSWINYTPEKVVEYFNTAMTAQRGTELHAFAHDAIRLGMKMENTNQTINMYINDCIGHLMETEQLLYYSRNAFGTADAISFRKPPGRDRYLLRIFDLKNGVIPAKEYQLEIYAAFFILEYLRPMKMGPGDIDYDLRIYQNDTVVTFETNPEDIHLIMERIKEFDKIIEAQREV